MLFVVPVVLFDMLKAKQLACVSESGQKCPAARSLSLRRAWIEISARPLSLLLRWCRSPYGERGLKFRGEDGHDRLCASLSLRRAWIEMWKRSEKRLDGLSRSPYGERGLKCNEVGDNLQREQSLSLRRAWIEIRCNSVCSGFWSVALLTESVD